MRTRTLKKLAALLVVAAFVMTAFIFIAAADELGGFHGSEGAVLTRSDEQAKSGEKSLKIVRDQAVSNGWEGPMGKIDLLKYFADSDGIYEVSFHVYQDETSNPDTGNGDVLTSTFNIEKGGKENYYNGDINTYKNWIIKDQWNEVKATFDFTDTATFEEGDITKAVLYFEHIEASKFYLDDFKIVKKGATPDADEVLLYLDFEDADEPSTPEEYTYDFEDSVQGWTGVDAVDNDIGVSEVYQDDFAHDGTGCLRVEFKEGYGKYQARMPLDKVKPGQIFTCKVYIPEGTGLAGFQPFIQGSDWGWESRWYNVDAEEQWLDVEFEIPDDVPVPIERFGIQFEYPAGTVVGSNGAHVFIDSVTLVDPPAPPTNGEEEEPPQTGDFGTIGFILLAAASGAVLAFRKRK